MSETPIPSDPVFRVSGGAKVLIAVFLVPLILFLTGAVVWFVANGSMNARDSAVLLATGFGFAAIFGGVVWTVLMTSVEVLPTGIRFTRGFRGVEELPFDGIAGYRNIRSGDGTALVIVTVGAAHKRIMIPQTIGRRPVLEKFIKAKFTDLDKAERDADMASALSDTQLGTSTEERRSALSRATVETRILHAVAVAAMFWAFLYPHPYAAAIVLLAVIPLASVAIAIFSHGAISLYSASNSVRPGVAYTMIVPAMVLALKGLKDWHILAWSGFWLPFAVLGILLIAILGLGSISDTRRTVLGFLGLSVVFLAEAYGLVLFANCYPDRSVPEIHRTTVVSRRISSGKSTTYYLYVGPWLDGNYRRQISVSRAFYEDHSDGSVVLIGVRQGVLHMPWFNVR
jgi:hypothetical protein